MSKKAEIHTITSDLYIAVVRTHQQFKEIAEKVLAQEGGKRRFSDAYSRLIADGLRPNEMGIFFVSKNGIVLDPSESSYKDGTLSIRYSSMGDEDLDLGGFMQVPYRQEGIRVEAKEVALPQGDDLVEELFSGLTGDLGGRLLSQILLSAISSRAANAQVDYWNDQTIGELVDLSLNLRNSFPNTSIFGVGNSPSYVVFAMDQLADNHGHQKNSGYIPFSDRFLLPEDEHSFRPPIFHVNTKSSEYAAAKKYQENYRHFLTTQGLHPREVVNRLREAGQKTTVLDNMQTGGSFASFVYFMYQWAEDVRAKTAFSKAFKCVALADEKIPEVIRVPDANLEVPITCVEISEDLRVALNSNLSGEKERFVPKYPPSKWGKPPQQAGGDPALIEKIKQQICAAMRRSRKCARPVIAVPYRKKPSAQPRR